MGCFTPRPIRGGPAASRVLSQIACVTALRRAAIIWCLFAVPVQAETTTSSSTDISPGGTSVSTRVADGFSAFFETSARYYSWSGSRGSNVFEPVSGKGSQFYSPSIIGFDYQVPDAYRLQIRTKTGYVHSNHATPGQQASLDTMVDTQATAVWTYLGSENYRTFVGVALNIPTGRSYLPNNLRFTRMDPDLVEIGSYGAGFNINPTAGVVFALTENTAMSLSAGYAWQGTFTREAPNLASIPQCEMGVIDCPQVAPLFDAKTRIDPGDAFTANVNTSSIFGKLAIKSSFAYMSESELKEDGVPIGKKGAKYAANLSATYVLDQHWSFLVNASWVYTRRDKIPGFPEEVPFFIVRSQTQPTTTTPNPIFPLVWERKNSNSNVIIGAFEPVYAITNRMSVSANYSILWRDENYYDFTESRFIPSKLKHSVGGSWSYIASARSSITVRGSYFWVHVDPGPLLGIEDPVLIQDTQSYRGWTGMVSGTLRF